MQTPSDARTDPIDLALARAGAEPPQVLLAPEHGFYGVEQDMIPSVDGRDPLTGCPILSLYGDSAGSLRPAPAALNNGWRYGTRSTACTVGPRVPTSTANRRS